jgi:MFS family permease
VAVATSPLHVLFVRLADRLGKGVRGAPRDAIIAAVTHEADRGRAFGFHRAMDHAGATVGPLLASAALLAGFDLRTVFGLALIPGLLAVLVLVFGVKEDGPSARPAPMLASAGLGATDSLPASGPASGVSADATLSRRLHRYLGVLALFALGNSSDAFLLLRAQEVGIAVALIPLLWTFHHLVKAGFSTFGGQLSDRIGRRRTIVFGWAVYAVAYLGFAGAANALAVVALFALYGLFHALTEGPEKAFVADLAPLAARGRAFGLYHAVTGIMILPGNLLTGLLWQRFGAAVALTIGAVLAAVSAALLVSVVNERHLTGSESGD